MKCKEHYSNASFATLVVCTECDRPLLIQRGAGGKVDGIMLAYPLRDQELIRLGTAIVAVVHDRGLNDRLQAALRDPMSALGFKQGKAGDGVES